MFSLLFNYQPEENVSPVICFLRHKGLKFNSNLEGIAGNESGLVVTECIGIDERFLSIAEGGGVA